MIFWFSVKLVLEWVRLQPQVLFEEGFSKRLQIWPSLSRLLNVLQTSLSCFNSEHCKFILIVIRLKKCLG